jgi:hypothetical protein
VFGLLRLQFGEPFAKGRDLVRLSHEDSSRRPSTA